MINQLDQFPLDSSVKNFFSGVENLAFERRHTRLHLAHLSRRVADSTVFGRALLGSAFSEEKVQEMIRRAENKLDEITGDRISASLTMQQEVRQLLQRGALEAQQWGAAKMSIDHFVLAILQNDDYCNELLPLDENQWRQSRSETRDRLTARRATVITHTPTLDMHSVDLTGKVISGDICWPVCGREEELVQVQRILLRRTKCNPLLVGPAGAGKTTLIQGLAASLLETPRFEHFRVCLLDLTSLIAGTLYRGELESRMKRILKELRDNPAVKVAIDELHVLQSGGSETSANCAEFFKPALANGEISVIGATCPEHLGQLFRDSAIERRFEPVFIDALKPDAVRQVLACVRTSLKKHYGSEYGVEIEVPDDVIEEIPAIADVTVPDRAEPDASITLLQDAMAAALIPRDGNQVIGSNATVTVGLRTLEEVARTRQFTSTQLVNAIQQEPDLTDKSDRPDTTVCAPATPRQHPQVG
jgi:ATP-dependent Clp protease ATP-binding subunit ClpA